MSISFDDVVNKRCKLTIDCTYQHGIPWDAGKDALSKLMHVKNVGGFRFRSKNRYVVLYSTNKDIYWRDELDTELGLYTYYGDNKEPGEAIDSKPGNKILETTFEKACSDEVEIRKTTPPFFLFERDNENKGVKFRGLLVPGYKGVNRFDWLTAVWAQLEKGGRFQNYKSIFTVLDTSLGCEALPNRADIDLRWLDDIDNGKAYESIYAPIAWKQWVDSGKYSPLVISMPSPVRSKDSQLPDNETGHKMLDCIYNHFKSDPHKFELFALEITNMADSNIFDEECTRPVRDGGRDGIGKYAIMKNLEQSLVTTFAVEAKCYDPSNSVGVKETSRLISRIRHRQFGVFVTTSYVAQQAYSEIIEDDHPIAIIAGKDIIDILFKNGITTLNKLKVYLNTNYPME